MKKGTKIILGIVIGFFILMFGGCAVALMGANEAVNQIEQQAPAVEQPAPTKKEAPAKEEPKMSVSQQNAVRQAETYIATMPFSKAGLVEQLKYEGYSLEDAKFAVENITVDWNEQAVKKAETYLQTMPFSKQKLIEQLKYDKFTTEQATQAVGKVGL